MMDSYVEQIRAVAQCAGWNLSQFLYHALFKAKESVAREIGMPPEDIAKLSKRERADISRKYRAAMSVIRIWPADRN
jgi:hypothetical protein